MGTISSISDSRPKQTVNTEPELFDLFRALADPGSVSSEEDLVQWKGGINPPPSNARCASCGRNLRELRPYGKAGDPLPADLEGALLVKDWRPLCQPDEEVDRIWEQYFGHCESPEDYKKAHQLFAKELGEKAEEISLRKNASSPFESVWLCGGCLILSADEYYEKFYRRDEESLASRKPSMDQE